MNTHLSRTKKVTREVVDVRRASRLRGRALLALVLAGFALTAGAARLEAQYGVARRTTVVAGPHGAAARSTTVVHGPNEVAAHSTTVVAGGRPALPNGYIGTLPAGYRSVMYRGSSCYMAGGVYYRASFYQGRTVYIRL